MPLPLNDENNPLYGLSIEAQCQVLFQWREKSLTAYQLLSLPQQYTQNQITKAYRQLAARFHPDKNPGNKSAEEAFKIIAAACEYMEYGLKSGLERHNAVNTIQNNPFYQVYGEQGLGRGDFAPFYFGDDRYTGFSAYSSPVNHSTWETQWPYQKSFLNLLSELNYYSNRSTELPVNLVDALKRHIEADKSNLITERYYSSYGKANIAHIIAYHGDYYFLKWLIEAGADPTIRAKSINFNSPSRDVTQLVAEKGNVDFLRYLLRRFGTPIFYDEAEFGVLKAQWWRFNRVLRHNKINKMEIALFLMNEVGYANHLSSQSFELFRESVLLINGFINSFDGLYTEGPSMEEKRMALKIWGLMLNQNNITRTLENLYLGIGNLLDCINKISWRYDRSNPSNYALRQEMFNLLNQLITRLDIQPEELAAIYSHQAQNNEQIASKRMICLRNLYNTALNHANYEILQQLNTISALPEFSSNTRIHLLKLAFFGWRHGNLNEFSPIHATKQALESGYKSAFVFLMSLGRLGTVQNAYTLKAHIGDRSITYEHYNLLHFACEAGWQDRALQLIENMQLEGITFDGIATRKEREYQPVNRREYSISPPPTVYSYSSLHLAIEKGLTQVAVRLIESGADINLKAVIKEPSRGCCFFGGVVRVEKTPLEMAIEDHQPQVIRALQRVMLESYIKKREEESEYLSQFSFFGTILFSLGCFNLCGLILGFGHSKTDKLQKAYEFRNLLNRDELDEDAFEGINDEVSQEGRLGQIMQLSHHYLTREPISINNPYQGW